MSGKLVGMVFDHYPNGGSELLLAVKLADNAHDDGQRIYPSVATLAAQTRQSERSVQYQLKRMVAMGWLVLVRGAIGGGRGGGSGRPREYRIHPDWIGMHDSRVPEEQRPTWLPLAVEDGVVNPKEMGANLAPIKYAKPAKSVGVDNSCDAVEISEMGAAAIAPNKKKWVQPSEEMGATAIAEMGATAIAPEPSLTVKEQTPPNPPPGGASDFDHFIQAWPLGKRTKLLKARHVFNALVAGGTVRGADLVATAASQAELQSWAGDGAKRVPAPDRWLREQRWLDGTAGQPRQGDAQAAAWCDSRQGVEAMGERLGLGRWDREAFGLGRGEPWPAYQARVVQAAMAADRKAA